MVERNETPKYLGKQHSEPVDRLDSVPAPKGLASVRLACSEFTSYCPVTGQPDFGEVLIEYVPDCRLVETKSLKLYLMGYRNERAYNEALAARIASEFYRDIKPKSVRVVLSTKTRGGIALSAESVVEEVLND